MLIEELDDNLLFRWFFGLNPDDPVWNPTTFTRNRDRLLSEERIARFLELLLAAPEAKPLLSSEHFSADGTRLRAWASHSSLERLGGSDDDPPPPSGGKGFGGTASKEKKRAKGEFRGLLLFNPTHRSRCEGEALLFRKSSGTGAYLSYLGHCPMENRHGLVVASEVTPADGSGSVQRPCGWPTHCLVHTNWGAIRATAPGISSPICAPRASRPMSPRTSRLAAAPPLTAARGG